MSKCYMKCHCRLRGLHVAVFVVQDQTVKLGKRLLVECLVEIRKFVLKLLGWGGAKIPT
jgi:hypothetical protein